MTTLQKTLATATVAVLAGVGIYETRQGAQLREAVRMLQQQQASLTEQIQQLQGERYNATNQLGSLAEEIAKAKSNNSELLRLRGRVNVLQKENAALAARKNSNPADQPQSVEPFKSPEANKTQETQVTGLARAKTIMLPQFKLDNVSFPDAVRELSNAGKGNDVSRKGVVFLISTSSESLPTGKITLALENVTLATAAAHIAHSVGLMLSDGGYAVVFTQPPAGQ